MRRERRHSGHDSSPAAWRGLAAIQAHSMRPCRRGRARRRACGATGDDQGPATVGQQGSRTDADVTVRRRQGSGCAAGDDFAARPRGPPPDRASEPPVKGQCLHLVSGGAVAGGRGPGWTDGPGWTGPRARGRGSCRTGV